MWDDLGERGSYQCHWKKQQLKKLTQPRLKPKKARKGGRRGANGGGWRSKDFSKPELKKAA